MPQGTLWQYTKIQRWQMYFFVLLGLLLLCVSSVGRLQADQSADPISNPNTICSPLQQLSDCRLATSKAARCQWSGNSCWLTICSRTRMSFPRTSWTVEKEKGLYIEFTSLMTAPSSCPIALSKSWETFLSLTVSPHSSSFVCLLCVH